MLFSSNVFLYLYFPLVLAMYFLTPKHWRNLTLFLVSLFFYGWGEPVYVVLMVATIALNYICGLSIHRKKRRGLCAKDTLILGVVMNLTILGFFKYFNFFVENLQVLIPPLRSWEVPQVSLPIGISFYVFQSMSYIIDVYRDDAPVQKNAINFGTYVTLFPQLIAGPIVRYADVAQQMERREENVEKFASGVRLFVVGLAKKVLLANQMGALWDTLQTGSGTLGAWVGIAAYSLQLYFDFSGYSDMAIGLGRMLGFQFLINFDYPYISRSITEFWRRWHMSLSTWFREYVYIPLGGNRKGLKRQIVNLLVVWGLTGFWHGASWNFLLWGLFYGLVLILEKLVLLKVLGKTPKPLRHVYALFIVLLGWALFYFEDMGALGSFFGRLFTPAATCAVSVNAILGYLPLLVVTCVAATPLGNWVYRRIAHKTLGRWVILVLTMVLFTLCVAVLVSNSYNPFIYFRF